MVAKKTAVQQSASDRSTGAGASGGAARATASGGAGKDVGGKKSARAEPAGDAAAPKKAAKAAKSASARSTKSAAPAKKAAKSTTSAAKKTAKAPAADVAAEESAAAHRTSGKAGAGDGTASTAKPGTAKKATGRKSAAKKTVASAAEDAAEAAKTTGATTVVAKKTQGTATAAKKPEAVPKARVAAAEPGELAVRPGEDPWTPDEVAEARAELQSEVLRLGSEIHTAEEGLAGLMRDSGDGAGDDDADTGTKNITREHEMALAANAREMLLQTERALERLDAGTYGLCENCGNPIGKARMQAFPRATLCVECKQKQERRS
ncbi:TraR/DksA C4-type zinc finger protein [Streptomyces sp. NPDC046716]|uniref:TraR/DksA family transcriptional regulator n=1 Tax=Streptomyces sp. NPDC046716 TaxID=3157093 RepID=UPI0034073CB9